MTNTSPEANNIKDSGDFYANFDHRLTTICHKCIIDISKERKIFMAYFSNMQTKLISF